METIRIAICDDDDSITDIMFSSVKTAFESRSKAVDIETFNSADSLGRGMKTRVFDLLFLDIEMPRLDGIAFGERLRKANDKTEIVYVSAREDRVFDAFRVRPFGFVRKSNFLGDLTKIISLYITSREKARGETLTVQSKSGVTNVPISSVICFEGCGKYQLMKIDGKAEDIPVYRPLEKLEEELYDKGFIRVHKGFLVNYRYISRILPGSVELIGGAELPVSRRKSATIKDRYLELLKRGGSVIL